MKYSYSYIITIQFLGFRFHGWQKQTNVKTLHQMIDKTLMFVFKHENFKTLGIGRTDSKVSANSFAFQLFLNEELVFNAVLDSINSNLPPDIRALEIKQVSLDFNIIKASKIKEYVYLFSHGEKPHPFSAPLLVNVSQELNIDLMKEGAKIFEGTHYFHKYCTKPSENTVFKRTIISCEIVNNSIYKANFFPEKSYMLRIKSSGFLRYQIRLIMGVLFQLGKEELTLIDIQQTLKEDNDRKPLKMIAPASGLQLFNIEFLN